MRSTTLWISTVTLTSLVGLALTLAPTANGTIATIANAPAIECGSIYQPQNYVTGNDAEYDDYFNIEPVFINDETVEQVRQFTSSIDGRWHGTGLDIRCVVIADQYSDAESLTTVETFDVDAEFEKHFLGALVMEIQQENKDQVNLDQIVLSPVTELDPSLETGLKWNPHGQKTGHRNFRVDLSSPGTLVFDEKYRRFQQPPVDNNRRPTNDPFLAVRLIHEIKTVSVDQTELTVNRDVYVNGRFVAQQQWQLERL